MERVTPLRIINNKLVVLECSRLVFLDFFDKIKGRKSVVQKNFSDLNVNDNGIIMKYKGQIVIFGDFFSKSKIEKISLSPKNQICTEFMEIVACRYFKKHKINFDEIHSRADAVKRIKEEIRVILSFILENKLDGVFFVGDNFIPALPGFISSKNFKF